MPRPDEGLIHAWLDGELDAAEAARIERLVRDDPEWAAAAADARGLIAASDRIITALDDVPGRVIPISGYAPARRRTPWWLVRAAAVLVVVAGTAIVLRREPPTVQESTPLQTAAPAAAPKAIVSADANRPAPAGQLKQSEALRDAPKDAKVATEAKAKTVQAIVPTAKAERQDPAAEAAAAPRKLEADALTGAAVTGVAAVPAEECYAVQPLDQSGAPREQRSQEIPMLVRATRTSDTTATMRSAQGATSTLRLRGDTLFIPADSVTRARARFALRTTCSPPEDR